MKLKSILSLLTTAILILSACSNKENQVLSEVSAKSGKISLILSEKIPVEPNEFLLSELVSDFRVIPLETRPECMISNTQLVFSKDFIFVGTQNFPGAARLYRFDNNGKFLNEYGKSGQGPGEHIGYMADVIHCYENEKNILVKWVGTSEKPQLFDFNGSFLGEVKQPYEFVRYIDRWSDSVWFSTGAMAGNVRNVADSFALVFYNSDGKIISQVPRIEYPPKNYKGYTPSPWDPSLYRFNNEWRLYMQGNDTVFRIMDFKLTPVAVIAPNAKTLPFNKPLATDELTGKNSFNILAETENNWFINKTIIDKAEVREFRPGEWGGGFYTTRQLLIVDKKSKNGINARLVDDIFGLFPPEAFVGLTWRDGKIFFAIQAIHLSKLMKDLKPEKITSQEAKTIIDNLKTLPEDSNPVIFSFTLKERVKLINQ